MQHLCVTRARAIVLLNGGIVFDRFSGIFKIINITIIIGIITIICKQYINNNYEHFQ